ncbi:hypothetical protein Poly51_16230 [Rubripirellula tenax]|uniref:DUF4380 domain-containing protein n=1 Tax=Rubripirellula tenax TaxID=2528015 RepID=A0A5C6FAM3_9BACT|nr:hypothetical protein [Rubripirellula tenax]TWU58843.1 hypothetical protein Poly51_16230 [Rubripirellula tenax]
MIACCRFRRITSSAILLCSVFVLVDVSSAEDEAAVLNYYGYKHCIRLSNASTSVTLCPEAGGRVLEYALDGANVLYLPSGDEGWTYEKDASKTPMNAGRFDIGPEKMVNRGMVLWAGPWKGEITGPRSARMTSEYDPESGVRLVRDFELHETTSQLRCTQTIVNESKSHVNLCHWSRTFAVGGGIVVVPRSPRGRFPHGYVRYENGNVLTIAPEDPNIEVSDRAVVIRDVPAKPKLGFDSHAGWFAYLAPSNQMFVKRFTTYPNRAYNEFAALTISVWYPNDPMVELEPIGPAENLGPGKAGSFTEEWWLLPHAFPGESRAVDFESIQTLVNEKTTPPSR